MPVLKIEVEQNCFHEGARLGPTGPGTLYNGGEGEAPFARLDEADESAEFGAVGRKGSRHLHDTG